MKPKFTLEEIALAANRPIVTVGGNSYGAYELLVPISETQGILFREGDDEENDHEIRIVDLKKSNKEHGLGGIN